MSRRVVVPVLVVALVLVAVFSQLRLWDWEVEDAAITFAYARNLADDAGLVPQPGAERVEGFSNPTWLLLFAATNLFRLDPFVVSRWAGVILGAGAVPLVAYALRSNPTAALSAAAVVATSAGHAIWAQSGLENALFSFLVAAFLARLSVADDRDVLGPLLLLGLALTRPEGIAWAAAGALVAIGRSPSRFLRCAALLALPVLLSEAARIAYFAQLLPATFYAKVGQANVDFLAWGGRGWKQVRDVASATAGVLPLLVLGAVGTEGRRASGAFAVLLLAPCAIVLPDRTQAAAGLALLLTLCLYAPRRPPVIRLATWWFVLGVLFQLGTMGDWMRGARFLSLVVVPAAVLVGTGLAAVAAPLLRAGAPAVALVVVLFGVTQARVIAGYDPEATPGSVRNRVNAWVATARKLGLDRRTVWVDHDMGGMLYWGSDAAWIRDARGLVDLPFALHGRTPAFVRGELFGPDRVPFDFVHRHASSASALAGLSKEMRDYVEIPGYGRKVTKHAGQWVRRDLFLEAEWPYPSDPRTFANGVVIEGLHVPSPEVGPGAGVYVEIGMRTTTRAPFRVIGFLARGDTLGVSWDLPPANDWVPVRQWRPGEVFHGRFTLPLPAEIAEGEWAFGVVVLTEDGRIAPALETTPPAFAQGETRWPDVVTIVSRARMNELAQEDLDAALANPDCEGAEADWERALRHRTRSGEWRDEHRPAVATKLANCWAEHAASSSSDLLVRIRELETARGWDPRAPAVWDLSPPIADEAHARALAATTDEERFRWYDAAVRADPRRSWDRRWAEQARTRLLWPKLPKDDDPGGGD